MDILVLLKTAVVVVSILLILVIVLQPSEADAGTLFGGGFAEEVKRTKRGFELFLHNATIFLVIIWVALAISIMFLR